MKRNQLNKICAVSSALLLFASTAVCAKDAGKKVQLQVRSLGTMTVTGDQLSALQQIKQALHRDYSMNAADADKLVCKVESITGSHLKKTLTCETNRQWWRREELQAVQMANAGVSSRTAGGDAAVVIFLQSLRARNMAFATPVNYARFHALMQAVPAQDQSKTKSAPQKSQNMP